jgi:hypothetical protein
MSYAELLKRICFVGEDASSQSHGWGAAHEDIVIGMLHSLMPSTLTVNQTATKIN